MKAQTHLLPTQPRTHTSQSKFSQCLFCKDYSLSNEELHKYYALMQQANILFEGPNQRWDLIKDLYTEYFGGNQPKVQGPQFLKLGFQSKYPQSDFRGGGILSLHLIIRFVKKNKQLVKKMEIDKHHFFFAVTSINICFYLKNYFHLSDSLDVERDKNLYCSRRALKNFCKTLNSTENFFYDLNEMLLKDFYKDYWVRNQDKYPQLLLQFNSLFERLKRNLKITFEESDFQDWNQFLMLWRNNSLMN